MSFKRPANLSKWVFIGKEGTFSQMLGGDLAYIRKVRAANRPVISIVVRPRGKYRFLVAIDLLEGFRNREHGYVFTDLGRKHLHQIMTSRTHLSPCHFLGVNVCTYASYLSLEDAVDVANALAALAEHPDIWLELETV